MAVDKVIWTVAQADISSYREFNREPLVGNQSNPSKYSAFSVVDG